MKCIIESYWIILHDSIHVASSNTRANSKLQHCRSITVVAGPY